MKSLLQFLMVLVGLVVILSLTLFAFRVDVGSSLRLMAAGAFGDKFGFGRTLVKATPLMLTGLGVVVAWRAGMFNIGGEGQFVVGGLSGAWVARWAMHIGMGGAELTVMILLAAILGGGAYGFIAGWMKVARGAEIVISTILLNFIAIQVLRWAVSGPLMEAKGGSPLTDQLPDAAMLWRPDRQTSAHIGIVIALVAAVLVWVFLFRTAAGFKLRVVGDNPFVARSNRISSAKSQLLAMALSGALCGLAGGIEYAGINGQIGSDFSQGWGFLGIPVAILGLLHPGFVVLSALYFGALVAGSVNLGRFTHGGDTLIYAVQGVAVLAVVGLQAWLPKRIRRAKEIEA